MQSISNDTIEHLKSLRLLYTAENWSRLIEENKQLTHASFLEKLARLEVVEKKSRSIQRRITEAKMGRFHKMESFDWNWPKEIDKAKIEALLNLDFLTEGNNVVFVAAQGLGKTMISKNMVWNAVNRGYKGLFTTASKIVSDLLHSGHKLEVALKKYTSPDVLVIDELGYLSFEQKSADVLFEVISRRYENKPIVLTTNLGFSDWPSIFPGAACVTALVDRLTHNAEILRITGDSYRTRQKPKRKKKEST